MIDNATRRRFLEAVLKYERAGVAQLAARRAAAAELCLPLAAFDEADASIAEKAEQVEIRRLAIAYGFAVYNLSQPRATKQTPGLPDLWLMHKRLPIACWWESKRQVGGALSAAQEEFRDDCLRTRTGYGTGDRYAFVDKLIELEVATRGAGQYGIEPVRLSTVTL